MSLVTARPAPDCMQPLDAAAAAASSSSSSDHAQHLWEHEMERFVETRGRSRSRSILAADTDTWRDSNHLRATSTRARSCSFSALEPPHSVSAIDYTSAATAALVPPTGASQCAAKRAASLSKIYLAGSAPVDVSQLQSGRSHLSGQKKVRVVQPTGALSAAALDALSEGLQLSVESSATPSMASATLRAAKREALTEEELEEKKMEEEEDCKLKAEKLSARRSLAVRASLFRSKMMKGTTRLLGTAGAMDEGAAAAAAAAATAAAATASATAAAAAAALESERSVESHAGAGADKSATTLDGGAAGDAAGTALPLKKKHKLKLLLLGDSGVGKTSLMRVFSGDEFSESMLATAGVDFKLRHISVADEAITLQIWDTAGQERFHRITSTYYKGANGIVLVYDVSDRRSFDNVGYWMNNIRQYSSPTQMPAMLLVGNKIDLPNRVVASEEGQAAASQYGCRFIETSAKTSENTNGALETIARDGFMISVNPTLTQKMVMDRENTLAGRRNKENCVIQ